MNIEFNQLGLHPELVQAVAELGYDTPTPIQAAIIPVLLDGADVIGQAQTGTGKTAAFSLPLIQGLQPDEEYVQGLILVPTRELAMQVAKAVEKYGSHLGVRVLPVYGGQPYGRQISQLKRGVDVVVGTPGRLLDLIGRRVLQLDRIRTVILDEADEMLSMGFVEDIELILKETPSERQTALFSATLPPEIRRLADRYMRDPQSVRIERKQLTAASVDQRYYLVNQVDKLAALTRIFEVEEISRALVFARTRAGTGELANELVTRGFPAEILNGDMSQEAREQVLQRFRQDQIRVLVATDVAARGLDIDDVSHVFNYDLPQDPEAYVHRIGRTARAGKSGVAISLVTPQEQWRLRRIEGYTKQQVTRSALPTVEEIEQQRETVLVEKVSVWLRRGRCRREYEMVSELAAAGYEPLEIAAAALKLARGDESQRPIAPVGEVQEARSKSAKRTAKPERRGKAGLADRRWATASHETGMVRLSLNAGKAHGLRPADVVSTIARHADIPGNAIGAIHIRPEQTLVDVPEQFVSQVLTKAGNCRIRKQAVTVERA